MLIKSQKTIPSCEITDVETFKNRRQLIKQLLALPLTGIATSAIGKQADNTTKWQNLTPSKFSKNLPATPPDIVKNYTNYYEFSFNKEDSTQLAQKLPIDPWSITITGEVEKPLTLNLADILKQYPLEERIYRFRCVEAWSMVIPWIGFPLAELIKKSQPLSTAKFVKFTAIHLPDVMPNQNNNTVLRWPYIEGLRMDEAMHPLTLLAVGMYGDSLPKQNGAPLRLIVPWKYGFKSIKAIVKIELVTNQPLTSWNAFAANEYGFYANVNPAVSHPRWSQNSERQLGSGFFSPRRQTELFNGYADDVSALYSNMDLRQFF